MSRKGYERIQTDDDDDDGGGARYSDLENEATLAGTSIGSGSSSRGGRRLAAGRRKLSLAIGNLKHLVPERDEGASSKHVKTKTVVGWGELPNKRQLFVVTMARLSEPLVQTSLQSYMFYQLKWFDPSLPDSVISSQAGILHASFTAAQLCTALLWGRIADSKLAGRKTVLMIGLLGTCMSCLGFGFSRSFSQALFFRVLGGITNGNVGVLRTMISEIVREKKYQSRAFLILPMTFNIGVIIGPILGGILSDPAGSYPSLFGDVEFFLRFPYAAPNLLSAVFLSSAALSVWLFLEETLDALQDQPPDLGVRTGHALAAFFGACFSRPKDTAHYYRPLLSQEANRNVEMSPITPVTPERPKKGPRYIQRLPFKRMFTRNVCFTLLSHFSLAFHIGTFNSLWFVFLSTPVYDPANPPPSLPHPVLPFRFTGGLGLPPRSVGMAMSILGVLGIILQIFFYPPLSSRLGTVRSWRLFLMLFPVTYFVAPFLSIVPSTAKPPLPKDGLAVWAAISGVLFLHVLSRTFALPGQTILVNNCSPHPSVLGTIHGLGQTVSSLARTIGPIVGGYLYGLGLSRGIIGAVWWGLSCVAICCVCISWLVREGDGHEIWLEGDDEDGSGVARGMENP